MEDTKSTERNRGHTLEDHRYGEDYDHTHDGDEVLDHDHDHDHDHFEGGGPLEENPLWLQDRVTLTSVGIDIGSAGTQVIFSRLKLRDRKSTRLNSSHLGISYAVFCLKKKNEMT